MVINVSLYITNVMGKSANEFNQDGIKIFTCSFFFYYYFFLQTKEQVHWLYYFYSLTPQFTYLNLEDSSSIDVK